MVATFPVLELDNQNGTKARKSTNISSNGNGHKHGNFDQDVVIIEDECIVTAGPEVEVEATIVDALPPPAVENVTPTKKKRSRKSKDSTESKDSDVAKKVEETVKSPERVNKTQTQKSSLDEEVSKPMLAEIAAAEAAELASSKRRSDRLQNASTIVNLSTISVSDQSTKIMSDETLETPTVERRVSGRRSTRPIDDIKFTYRTPNPNDSMNATTNATIGSDTNNDSLFATPGADRKRRQIDESMENIDSPKRSRLDLSGLFSSFASPVTMLRNKFRRANIASTPIVPLCENIDNPEESGDLHEIDLNAEEVVAPPEAAPEEELQVITTPVKKSTCVIM